MIRVAIVDDHPIVADGLAANLRSAGDIEVAGTARTAADAVALARREHPDVLVLDLELGGRSGLEIIASINAASPSTRILVFTAYAGEDRVAAAFERGVASYVLKGAASDEIIAAVRTVAQGGTMISPEIADQLARAMRVRHAERLTPREREIVVLLAAGLSNREIGERLGIAERTVKFHVGEILARLGASNRAQAVAIAQARGLV